MFLENVILPKQKRVRRKKPEDVAYIDSSVLVNFKGQIPVSKSWAIENNLVEGEGLPKIELTLLSVEEL